MFSVYVIVCEDDHYYIGAWGGDVHTRFLQHAEGKGARFTQVHKPLSYSILERCPRKKVYKREHEWTLNYVRKYGFRKVRGGNWLSMQPDCYTPRTLFFLLGSLKPEIQAGLLGKVDPPAVSAF